MKRVSRNTAPALSLRPAATLVARAHPPVQRSLLLTAVLLSATLFHAAPACACAACYGQSDSPLASGMNWGILSLLGIIILVLGGVVWSFISMARRAARFAAANARLATTSGPSSPPTTANSRPQSLALAGVKASG